MRVTYLPPGERRFGISLGHAWHGDRLGVMGVGWVWVGEGVRVRMTYFPPGERKFWVFPSHTWHGDGLGVMGEGVGG